MKKILRNFYFRYSRSLFERMNHLPAPYTLQICIRIIQTTCAIFLSAYCSPVLAHQSWDSFKNDTVEEMQTIPGWCSKEKALLMMDIIKKYKCKNCVEVGVFSGMSLFPMARALQYIKSGKVTGIDAWDRAEAVKGFLPSDPNYHWWFQLDYKKFYEETLAMIRKNKLAKHCTIMKIPSRNAVNSFLDETIDFIHFDGNHNEDIVFRDVIEFFPKVKDGGYILLNDPNWLSMRGALIFLLERSDSVSSFSGSATYLLLRKNNRNVQNAQNLFLQ